MKSKKIHFLLLPCLLFLLTQCGNESNDAAFSNAAIADGQGGSWARFTVEGDYLYTVTEQALNVFDIGNPEAPRFMLQRDLGDNIETIYARDTTLFVGSKEGMMILGIRQPTEPVLLSFYRHRDAIRCPASDNFPREIRETNDPVVADGNFAYLTLKAEAECPGDGGNFSTVEADQLIVFDISDLRNPVPIGNYDMEEPEGVGTWGNLLFVCDNGLKIFDKTRPDSLQQIGFYAIPAYDVIPLRSSLLITADDGFHQYDIRGNELEYVSSIRVGEP